MQLDTNGCKGEKCQEQLMVGRQLALELEHWCVSEALPKAMGGQLEEVQDQEGLMVFY